MMGEDMRRIARLLAASLPVILAIAALTAHAAAKPRFSHPRNFQETGFLNRSLEFHNTVYRFTLYLPEGFRRDDHKQ